MPAPRAHAAACLNDEGIPVLASDPRLVWEAGLLATRGQHICEEFFRRRRVVLAVEAAMAAVAHGEATIAELQAIALLRQEPGNQNLNLGTVRRWRGDCKKHGEQRLVPRWAKEEGSKSIPKRLQTLLEAFYAQGGDYRDLNKPTVAQCHRELLRWWPSYYAGVAEPPLPPCPTTVQRFIERLLAKRPALLAAAREGKDAFRDRFGFHVIRDPKAIALGLAVCLDHRVMDTHIILPSGKIGRPWLTAIQDIHSADMAFVLRDQVSSDGVASVFRRWITGYTILDEESGEIFAFPAHGIPGHAIVDHGKEFHGGPLADTVQARGGRFSRKLWHSPKDMPLDPGVAQTLFEGLDIHRSTATPYLARAKGIEAAFSSFATRLENLIAGHCGRNTSDKPDQLAERRKRGDLLSWSQYLATLARAYQQWRTERPIGKMRDKPPAEYWADWQGELPDPRRLDNLLLHKEAKRIQGRGIEIQHGKDVYHYISDDPEFALASGALVPVLWTQDDTEACIAIVGGKCLICLRSDLRQHSFDLLLGHGIPAEHRLVNRARGAQSALRMAYQRWARETRTAACLDPLGNLSVASRNGSEIRTIARDIRRPSLPPPAQPAVCRLPSAVCPDPLDAMLAAAGAAEAARLDPQLEPMPQPSLQGCPPPPAPANRPPAPRRR